MKNPIERKYRKNKIFMIWFSLCFLVSIALLTVETAAMTQIAGAFAMAGTLLLYVFLLNY